MSEKSDPTTKREQKIKEKILDETFKKAEISRGIKLPEITTLTKKHTKKIFPKLGILLIIVGVIGIIFINNLPWAFIRYGTGDDKTETFIYRDFEIVESLEEEINALLKSPYYLGISDNDFIETPSLSSYCFFSLVILGVVITLFGLLDRWRNLSLEVFTITHFIFATIAIIPGIIIVLSVIKFLGAHILLFHNAPFVTAPDVIVFPTVFIIIALGFIIIKMMFTVMRMDFTELQKIRESNISKQSSAHNAFRG